MKKSRTIMFILLGFVSSAGVLLSQYLFCLDNWNHDYKAQVFDTFSEYFISVSKGAILFSVMLVFIPPVILLLNHIVNRLIEKESGTS